MTAAASIDVRFAARNPWVPPAAALRRWVREALRFRGVPRCELSLHIVGARAARGLNARYRGKDHATNVLSFAGAGMSPSGIRHLGELVICAPVLERESRLQGIRPAAHWAHITVHGVLHLLGFDHQQPRAAREMEAIETQILESMGFSNPYRRF